MFNLDDFIFELSCNIESAICLYFESITCKNKETMENMLRIEMLKAIEATREKLEKYTKEFPKIEKELDMNTCRYSKLLEDLKQCTELVDCDIDEMVIQLSKREKKALIEVIDIFENIFMHFEGTDSLRYYLDDED